MTNYLQSIQRRYLYRLFGGLFAAFLSCSLLVTQAGAQEIDEDTDEEAPIRLAAFDVTSPEDEGYRLTNALTAMRIGTPIIETPLNISVISRELLDDIGVRGTVAMFDYAAGVYTNYDAPSNALAQGTAKAGLKIRGFHTSFVYQDNFRRTKTFHIDGIDRTEIVKGPNGLYFGRTDPGGIVNIITKKPQFHRATEITATIGNDSYYKGMIDHQNVAIEDQLAYRVVGSYRDSDDWFQHTEWEEEYFMGAVTWRPIEQLEFDLQFEYFNQNRDGGRVPLIVGTEPYLVAAANGDLVNFGTRDVETRGEFQDRVFEQTGVAIRNATFFWLPENRAFNWNRNGIGAFDDNLGKTWTLESRFEVNPDTSVRVAYDYVDDIRDTSWFINQDPHQAPNMFATYFNDGEECFTCLNYGFFQAPVFDPSGGTAPGRGWDASETHSIQADLTHSFEMLNSSHTLIGSVEWVQNKGTSGGYLNDIDAFVRAGAIPAGSTGLGNDPQFSAESNQLLAQRHAEMVNMGLLQPGEPWNTGAFSQFFVNVDTVEEPEIPNKRDWLTGRNPEFNTGSDTIDRSASLAYRGDFLERRLITLAGVRYMEHNTTGVANAGDNVRERRGWESFSEWLPTVGANYYITPEVVAYGSVSRTFLPQAGNINPIYTNEQTGETIGGDVMDPERGIGWELGVKTSLDDGIWTGTLSYFQLTRERLTISWNTMNERILNENLDLIDQGVPPQDLPWRDQTGSPFTATNRPGLNITGGEQQTRGVEFDLIWSPIPSFQGVFSAMHLFRAEWTVMDPQVINVNRGGLFEGQDGRNDGRDAMVPELQNVPANQFSAWGKYTFQEGALANLSVGFGGMYMDSEIHEQRPNGNMEPFTSGHDWKFDAMASYRMTVWENDLTLHLAVNNVFDSEIVRGTFGQNPTREWSLSARYSF